MGPSAEERAQNDTGETGRKFSGATGHVLYIIPQPVEAFAWVLNMGTDTVETASLEDQFLQIIA